MPVGRVRVNKLKNRESWRPFAGVIDEESAPYWFDMKNEIQSFYVLCS